MTETSAVAGDVGGGRAGGGGGGAAGGGDAQQAEQLPSQLATASRAVQEGTAAQQQGLEQACEASSAAWYDRRHPFCNLVANDLPQRHRACREGFRATHNSACSTLTEETAT